MKHRFINQFEFPIIYACLALLLAGCARFEHQTTELESHALVTVLKPRDSSDGALKTLDGLPVSRGKTYRLRPGSHVVVVEFVETVVETAKPMTFSIGNARPEPPANVRISESGRVLSVSGEQPFTGMQPVNLSMEVRRIRSITNSISIQAGGHYDLVGDRVTPRQLPP